MHRLALAAALLSPALALAQPVRAVQPLDGHVCMGLNVPVEFLRNGPLPFVLAAPRQAAPHLGTAGATVLLSTRRTPVNGFAPVMHLDGRLGWIEAKKLRAWRSESDPGATCTPMLMSDGRPGFR